MISECFLGLQGEGNTQGKCCFFIRFRGCNLSCKICDSKFSHQIHRQNMDSISIDVVKKALKDLKSSYHSIVFTGGEPLLYQEAICDIIHFTEENNLCFDFEIETNGTIKLKQRLLVLLHDQNEDFYIRRHTQFNISPKFNIEQQSKNNVSCVLIKQLNEEQDLCHDFLVKYLFGSQECFAFIDVHRSTHDIPKKYVYVQPIGTSKRRIVNTVKKNYEEILKYGFNLSLRQHVILFGNKRGV